MKQLTSHVLMVRPAAFGYDPASAESNHFQHRAAHNPQVAAVREFTASVAMLRRAGVDVTVLEDTQNPQKPDAVFPNNWLSTWPDGHIFLYPMCVEARRLERRPEIIAQLSERFTITRTTDISGDERKGFFLESTGAIVFDHINKIAYGNSSPRCDEFLFQQHARALGYKPHILHATDETGTPIYHTNVMLAIQTNTAVVCGEALPPQQRQQLIAALQSSGREVVVITLAQMRHFAGNVLELENNNGQRLLALSKSAFSAFRPQQRAVLASDKTLLPMAIPTIESVGGGSIRCMIAEIFLPLRAKLL